MTDKDIKEKLKKALEENAQKETHKNQNRGIFITVTGVLLIALFTFFGSSLFSSNTTTGPWGQIKNPPAGKTTGQKVKVYGETKNIQPGQYIWLAVDKADIGLCWPKMQITGTNSIFQATIMEEGPEEPYTLSLYLVNQTVHKQWKGWLNHEIFGGVHMPPKNKRLDSVRLLLKN